jgi:cytochrome c
VIQLFVIAVTLLLLPKGAYSNSIFFYSALSIISIFLTTIFFYTIIRNAEMKYAGVVFFLVFLTFTFTIVKSQLAFGNANKEQLLVVNMKAEELIKENYPQLDKKEVAGVVNAEEIFNTRCIACHKFDTKLVGPPFNETIPKYEGDAGKLAKFILNPIKINPDYPDMPNQGLKKEEADALAKFLIEKVQKK